MKCCDFSLFSPSLFPQGKKGKDPNAPKRPLSAYMLWLNANRDKIRADSPGMSVTDVSKKAGELWKGMSKEKKEVGNELIMITFYGCGSVPVTFGSCL